MPQIDLEPKDYRAEPVKGEPVFVPGAGRRALVWSTTLVLLIALGIGFRAVVAPVLEPMVRSIVSVFFN